MHLKVALYIYLYFLKSDFFFLYFSNSKCRRCVVMYEKHANVLQYKESECEENISDQNPAAMPMRSTLIKVDSPRKLSPADQFISRTDDAEEECEYLFKI